MIQIFGSIWDPTIEQPTLNATEKSSPFTGESNL